MTSQRICHCGLVKQKPSVLPDGVKICLNCNLPTDPVLNPEINMLNTKPYELKKIVIKDSTNILLTINSIIAVLSAIGSCFIIFTAKTCVEIDIDGICTKYESDTGLQAFAFTGILYTMLIANLVIVFVEHVRRSIAKNSN